MKVIKAANSPFDRLLSFSPASPIHLIVFIIIVDIIVGIICIVNDGFEVVDVAYAGDIIDIVDFGGVFFVFLCKGDTLQLTGMKYQ